MTTLTISEDYSITDGPSREELFDALRLFKEHRRVTFVLLPHATKGRLTVTGTSVAVKAQIQGIAPEDGSGHSWCLQVQFISDDQVTITNSSDRIDLYYSDKNRHGGVVDARPLENRIDVHRDGTVWQYGHKIGHIDNVRA